MYGIGETKFAIPGKYMRYAEITRGSATCFGALQSSSQVGINIWGGVALKSAFVVFEAGEKPRIGWAPKELN